MKTIIKQVVRIYKCGNCNIGQIKSINTLYTDGVTFEVNKCANCKTLYFFEDLNKLELIYKS